MTLCQATHLLLKAMTDQLEPIEPEQALEMYLRERETEVAEATLYSHKSRLGHFVRWCGNKDIDNLNEITGRDLHEYRLWRRNEGDLSKPTEKTQMNTLRVFIRWCEGIDAVHQNLSDKVQSPDLNADENVRDRMIDSDRAEQILDYLNQFEYSSFRHCLFRICWVSGCRTGAIRALDLADFDSENLSLHIQHRPEQGTPLKNGTDGERLVAIRAETARIIQDYIETNRHDVTDDSGREPLLTTSHGRPACTTIRQHIYTVTQPCYISTECPHGKDPESCEWTGWQKCSMCPSSLNPHAIRRGSITHHLLEDAPREAVSDRMNVKSETLDKHYDKRSLEEKMEQRRQFFS